MSVVPLRNLVSGSLLLLACPTWAAPPDAGLLWQLGEYTSPLALPGLIWAPSRVTPDPAWGELMPASDRLALPPLPAPPLSIPVGTRLTASSFQFVGNTRLSAAQLAQATAPFAQRPLDFAQLQAAAAAVEAAYRTAGWVARAYFPQQPLVNGELTVAVLENVLGQVWLDHQVPIRLAPKRAGAHLTTALPLGQALHVPELERGALLLGDVLGRPVRLRLRQGQHPAVSDALLSAAPVPGWRAEAGLDNGGHFAVGSLRMQGTLQANSLSERGDWLHAQGQLTEGSRTARLGYTLALGTGGARFGVNLSALRYDLLAQGNGSGTADSVGLAGMYPLRRSRLDNLNLLLNYDFKHFDNQRNGLSSSRTRSQNWTIALQGAQQQPGREALAYSLQWTRGLVDLSGSPTQALDGATTRVADGFHRLRYQLAYRREISERDQVYLGLSGQWASNNLDSAERLYLGGPQGVRAYPVGEAGGAEGQLWQVEWRRQCQAQTLCTLFYDGGNIRQYHRNNFVGAAAQNQYAVHGIGAALHWQPTPDMQLQTSWARRLGHNPNPAAAGLDQDGTLRLNRVWLQLRFRF